MSSHARKRRPKAYRGVQDTMGPIDSIDYEAVRRYFDKAAGDSSAAASYMAHGQDLPEAAVHYRFKVEVATLNDWLDAAPASGTVLDLGCGAGAWTAFFADRYAQVVGVEGSKEMAQAARQRTKDNPNVEILEADIRAGLPEGEFHLIFLGGLCMYLNDDDVVDLLRRLKHRLRKNGAIVLRESTVPHSRRAATGDYGALYRTPADYHELFHEAGFRGPETRRNFGYTAMEIAIEIVNARRRWLPFLPKRSALLGAMTWWPLRATAPVSFSALPRALERMGIAWPALQNHFFRLRP
jgi:SAM-dependent methyltransferase